MRRSRLCVPMGLLLFGTVLVGQRNPAMPPDAERQLAREIYKEMVEIKSGYTTGATTPVAEAAARAAEGGRISRRRHLRRRRDPDQGQPRRPLSRHRRSIGRSCCSRTPTSSKPSAKTGPWIRSRSPRRDGYFYGRGTGDDKAQAAVWIANLIRYKREGFKPDRDIIVALTADEEGGGPYNGVDWLLKNKRDLIDAEFCLNEGGWGESVAGKRISNDVQVSEKYVINYRLEVTNKGGHSSLPVAGQRDLSPGRCARSAVEVRVSAQDQRGDAGATSGRWRRSKTRGSKPTSPRWPTAPADAMERVARATHGLERDAAHDVRGDAARRRTREERAAAARGGERELPCAARRQAGVRHRHAEAGHRRRSGERHDRGGRLERTAVADAAGPDERGQHAHERALAGRADRADDGDGRDRRRCTCASPASRPTACRASSTIATTSGSTAATSA